MRAYLVIAILVPLAYYILAEKCHDDNDCMDTFCNANTTHIECLHGQCSCEKNPVRCISKMDCDGMVDCHGHDEKEHCLDGGCVCIKDHDLPHGPEHGPGHHP